MALIFLYKTLRINLNPVLHVNHSPPFISSRCSSGSLQSNIVCIALAAFFLFSGVLQGQVTESASDIVGYNKIDCPGGSDTAIGIPFHRAPVFYGMIEGNPGATNSLALITPAGSPSLAANAFTSTPHYLRILSGNMGGSHFEIRANSGQSITIEVGSEDISALAADDRFDIVPHWTLSDLFPPDSQIALHASTGLLPSTRGSRVLFANQSSDGIDLAPDRIYFVTDQGWFQAAAGFPAADDVVVRPGEVLIIRHNEGADDTVFFTTSHVNGHKSTVGIRSRSAGPQDNSISLVRPVPVKLSELDLGSGVFEESASTDPADRKDELFVYDNLTQAQNKGPETTYFRVAGQWKEDDGNVYPDSDSAEIQPSTALMLRKSSTALDEVVKWTNTPRY